jgi:hypothetical protein
MNKNRLNALTGKLRSARSSPDADNRNAWVNRRGASRFSGQFDVIGNFPGYGGWAALIVSARVDVTSRYLLVDETATHGFGIELVDLLDYSIDKTERSFGDVIVRYRLDGDGRIFRLRPARSRLRLPTRSSPTALAESLAEGGVIASTFAETLESTLSLNWESATALESETTVWSGKATAPLKPGMECEPGSVWLSKSALLWGSSKGTGVNRLPTGAITGIVRLQLPDDRETPIAYVETNLINGVDLTLPFIFNHVSGAQARIDRDAFVALFHPDLVKPIDESPLQPWTEIVELNEVEVALDEDELAKLVDETDSDDSLTDSADSEAPTEPTFATWDTATRPISIGESSGSGLRRIDYADDLSLKGLDPDAKRLVEAIAAWPSDGNNEQEPEPEPAPITEPKMLLNYLARARQTIVEVNDAIDRRAAGNAAIAMRSLPPSATEQAAALMELIELTGSGYYSPDGVNRTKAQISGLGEAAIRLRSLIELCNAGHMTIAEAASKRDRIMTGIAMLLESE